MSEPALRWAERAAKDVLVILDGRSATASVGPGHDPETTDWPAVAISIDVSDEDRAGDGRPGLGPYFVIFIDSTAPDIDYELRTPCVASMDDALHMASLLFRRLNMPVTLGW